MLMKRNYLLPHAFQRIGVALGLTVAVLLVVYCAACFFIAFDSPEADSILSSEGRFTNTAAFIVNTLLCLCIFLMGFSYEECEDEMIDAVRKSSVVSTAYGVFIIYLWCVMAGNMANFIMPALNLENNEIIKDLKETITDPVIIFVIYELVFRTRLSKLRKALRDEE